jgi:hypothetical protein
MQYWTYLIQMVGREVGIYRRDNVKQRYRMYVMGGIYNDRYEGTSRGRKLDING